MAKVQPQSEKPIWSPFQPRYSFEGVVEAVKEEKNEDLEEPASVSEKKEASASSFNDLPPGPLDTGTCHDTHTRRSVKTKGVLEIELWQRSDAQTAGHAPKDML